MHIIIAEDCPLTSLLPLLLLLPLSQLSCQRFPLTFLLLLLLLLLQSILCQVRAAGSSDEPYIAAIVSPYNKRLPGLQSSVTWFRVEGGGKAGANVLEQVRG
jgi:hypothetical protein